MTNEVPGNKLKAILSALDEKKGVNIMAFDIDKDSGYADYMIFVTGTSTQHNKTLADFTLRSLKDSGFGKVISEGEQQGRWVLIDSGNVIVHIMLEELRDYYDLESIWRESPRVNIKEVLTGS